jgi:hypothetical protein
MNEGWNERLATALDAALSPSSRRQEVQDICEAILVGPYITAPLADLLRGLLRDLSATLSSI